MSALESLRNLARYKTHAGYVWAMVADDGELICTPCVRANYRQIFRATKEPRPSGWRDGWRCEGITNSGEHEGPPARCAHCNAEIFASTEEPEDMDEIPNGSELFLSDARGIYIPRDFANTVKRACVDGVKPEDWEVLAAGPDHESYWDTWASVLDNARLLNPDTGRAFTLYQDGDLWLVPTDGAQDGGT